MKSTPFLNMKVDNHCKKIDFSLYYVLYLHSIIDHNTLYLLSLAVSELDAKEYTSYM